MAFAQFSLWINQSNKTTFVKTLWLLWPARMLQRLNEKIDIWSFGNNIYALLTGLWVFYDKTDKDMQKKVLEGETAYLDPRYRDRNYIQDKLIEMMERCWAFSPDDRPDAFEIVRFLRDVKKEGIRLEQYNDTLAETVLYS